MPGNTRKSIYDNTYTNTQQHTQSAGELPPLPEPPGYFAEPEPVPSVQSNADLFEEYRKEVQENRAGSPLNIGFPLLGDTIRTALCKGLICLGAAPSAGKTTFIMQMAYSIATRSGRDVLMFALEMSRNELIARDISRLTFLFSRDGKEKGAPRNVTELLSGCTFDPRSGERVNFSKADAALIERAEREYQAAAQRIYIFESPGEMKASQIDAIARKFAQEHPNNGKPPVIFVDYLQLLAAEDPRQDERRAITQSTITFKNLSRDLKTPVFIISATARANYYETDPEGFGKESGIVEYSADTTLFMQYSVCFDNLRRNEKITAVKEAENKPERDIVLSVIKNRAGRRSQRIRYKYSSTYNAFEEMGFFTKPPKTQSQSKGRKRKADIDDDDDYDYDF